MTMDELKLWLKDKIEESEKSGEFAVSVAYENVLDKLEEIK